MTAVKSRAKQRRFTPIRTPGPGSNLSTSMGLAGPRLGRERPAQCMEQTGALDVQRQRGGHDGLRLTAPIAAAGPQSPCRSLRKEFSVTGQGLERALLHVASGAGSVRVKHQWRQGGEQRTYAARLEPTIARPVFYDSYDVTAMVRSGNQCDWRDVGHNGMYRVRRPRDATRSSWAVSAPCNASHKLHLDAGQRQ